MAPLVTKRMTDMHAAPYNMNLDPWKGLPYNVPHVVVPCGIWHNIYRASQILRGKKAKFRGTFRCKFAEKSAVFAGKKSKFTEKSADFAGFSQERSQNSEKSAAFVGF